MGFNSPRKKLMTTILLVISVLTTIGWVYSQIQVSELKKSLELSEQLYEELLIENELKSQEYEFTKSQQQSVTLPH